MDEILINFSSILFMISFLTSSLTTGILIRWFSAGQVGGGGEELWTLAKELLTLLVELLGDTVLDVDIFCMVRLNKVVKLKDNVK